MTGPAAEHFLGFQDAVKARIDEQNAQGGVNGRKIVVVPGDDQGDGARQVTTARSLVQDEQVFAIVATIRNDTMFPFLKQNNVPVFASPSVPAFGTDRNAFGISGAFAPDATSTAIADFMKAKGVTKLALTAHNTPGSTGGAKQAAVAAQAVNLAVGYSPTDIPVGSFDATATALRIREDGDDGLYSPLLAESGVSLSSALNAQSANLKAKLLTGIYDPKVVAQAGPAVEGAWSYTTPLKPLELDDAAVKQYLKAMNERAPDFIASPHAGYGYVAADLFIHGLQLAGDCVTRDNFVNTLRGSDGFDANGLLYEKVSFKPGLTPNGNPPACNWFVQVRGGALTPEPQATCGKLVKTG
jgi:ABC-type branched-subunit amino acid transport system substrate-binding protein